MAYISDFSLSDGDRLDIASLWSGWSEEVDFLDSVFVEQVSDTKHLMMRFDLAGQASAQSTGFSVQLDGFYNPKSGSYPVIAS